MDRMRSVSDESGVLLKSDNLMNRRKNRIIGYGNGGICYPVYLN